jgi:hypothetical protein
VSPATARRGDRAALTLDPAQAPQLARILDYTDRFLATADEPVHAALAAFVTAQGLPPGTAGWLRHALTVTAAHLGARLDPERDPTAGRR